MTNEEVLFATTNRGKLKEVQEIAINYSISILSIDDVAKSRGPAPEVEENADSYQGNAALKASAYSHWSGLATIADDTGLEVYALNGAPGIRSARYAGDSASARQNQERLLIDMQGTEQRAARFICVLVYHSPQSVPRSAEAALAGEIALTPQGEGGFGYDSIFFLPDLKMTLSEAKEKSIAVETHRIKALRILFGQIIQQK